MDDGMRPPLKMLYDEGGNIVILKDNDPEYGIRIDDLNYHIFMYCQVPPLRPLTVHMFKQCLILFMLLRTEFLANDDAEKAAFEPIITATRATNSESPAPS